MRTPHRRFPSLWVRTALVLSAVTLLAVPSPLLGEINFSRDIRPILARNCASCHGPDEQEGGLNLLDPQSAQSLLDSGERAIVAFEPAASVLMARVATTDDSVRMPPDGEGLSPDEIGALRSWIKQGAPWAPHWSYTLPNRPPVPPEIADADWSSNPIDRFIRDDLEAAGIVPAAPAEPLALMRRVTYDLTGLPPTPEEVRDYLLAHKADPDDAYRSLIDRLLDSPQYGEKWGRHWLDLVRYGESNGYERDNLKPYVWKYRDYVIRSFNADKPYDQFIREQLAGDEIPSATAEQITATGYYRLGLWDDEPVDATQAYYDHLDDVVTTTSEVFLATTLHCARCHDHKIDPISQRDYYRFMAFFHNIRKDITKGRFKDGPFTLNTLVDVSPPELQERHREAVRAKETELASLNREWKIYSDRIVATFSRPEMEDAKDPATRRRMIRQRAPQVLAGDDLKRWKQLQEQREQVTKRELPTLDMVLAVTENPSAPPPTHVLARGNAHAPGEQVTPGYPAVLGFDNPNVPATTPHLRSSGRRTVLANWVASPDNPFTSRVIVNRIWQHFFGRGIVASSSDFGFQGSSPTHPELLDWLAASFVDGGWKFKSFHRMILTSRTYQMSSQATVTGLANDPENQHFSRQNMRRLTAEEIRDSMLSISGHLNLEPFGSSIAIALAPEVLHSQSRPGKDWSLSPPDQQDRRSIYVRVKRSLLVPLLDTFDMAEPDVSCPVRFSTTQPTQALALLNSRFAGDQATRLAARLRDECGDEPTRQVERALWLVTQRPPRPAEVRMGLDLMNGTDHDDPLELLCLMMLNLNEFLFLD